MSLLLNYVVSAATTPVPPGAIVARPGICRYDGQVIADDAGVFHPLGLTLFWSLYGWKYERDRIVAHLQWISQYAYDYLRILGEVDWEGRSIEPTLWPDYNQILQEFVDAAYDTYGLRSQITIVGGTHYDQHDGHERWVPSELATQVVEALRGREHKVIIQEMANEWDRLDKVDMDDLVTMGQIVASRSPNLVALSRPADTSSTTLAAIEMGTGVEPTAIELERGEQALMNLAHARQITFHQAAETLREALGSDTKLKQLLGRRYQPHLSLVEILDRVTILFGPNVDTRETVDTSGRDEMIAATKNAGGDTYTPHLRRSDHDEKWSHVRQGYDLKDYPTSTSNNEPQGPQSSVDTLDSPLQLACARLLGIMCGGASYVLHVGQGVTGVADPKHGRPENMWEVPNIDQIMRVVRQVDVLIPAGIENWKVVNNGRSDHPLPLDPETGFWEGDHPGPAVNKNYAAYFGSDFIVMLTGCKSAGETGPVPAGTARRACLVQAYDPVTLEVVAQAQLMAGESWSVPGRGDTMAGYLVQGRWI